LKDDLWFAKSVLEHLREDQRELELNVESVIPVFVVEREVLARFNFDRLFTEMRYVAKAKSDRIEDRSRYE